MKYTENIFTKVIMQKSKEEKYLSLKSTNQELEKQIKKKTLKQI